MGAYIAAKKPPDQLERAAGLAPVVEGMNRYRVFMSKRVGQEKPLFLPRKKGIILPVAYLESAILRAMILFNMRQNREIGSTIRGVIPDKFLFDCATGERNLIRDPVWFLLFPRKQTGSRIFTRVQGRAFVRDDAVPYIAGFR